MVRCKNRYILIQVRPRNAQDPSAHFKSSHIHDAIHLMVQQLFGDFGVAAIRAGFVVKYCNEYTKIAVIRCRKGPHQFVSSSLPCIKYINGKLVSVDILYIGASIKHCHKFLKDYQEKKFNEYCATLKTDKEKSKLKMLMFNLTSIDQI